MTYPTGWAAIAYQVDRLWRRHLDEIELGQIDSVFPIPRGGCVPAALFAGIAGVAIVETPGPNTLIIDDLVDSGATAARYQGKGIFDALYRKPHSPIEYAPDATEIADWIAFPWEAADEEAGPADAVTRLIEHIGEDPTRSGLKDTPGRVLRALTEMTAGYREDPSEILSTTFEDRCDEMVVVSGIDFTSMCEHHLLTFTGVVDLAYIPGDRVVGLSKLPRVVDAFARRLQVQERMTEQIADAINDALSPRGVGVVVRASHSCMACRGVKKAGAIMTTSALRGYMKTRSDARAEFLNLSDSRKGH